MHNRHARIFDRAAGFARNARNLATLVLTGGCNQYRLVGRAALLGDRVWSAAGARRLAGSWATVQSGEADRPRSAFSRSKVAANRWIDRSRLIAPAPNRHRSPVKLYRWVVPVRVPLAARLAVQ